MVRIILSLIVAVLSAASLSAATISSTSSGGDWNTTGTWVGNVVPGSSDDVIINGIVSGSGSCRNLTISSGATLQQRSGYGDHVYVYGNITNNGTITNAPSGSFTLSIYGTITNNGTWNNRYVNFNQTGNVTFAQAANKSFESVAFSAVSGKADSFVLATNVTFKKCSYSQAGSNARVFVTKGNDLTVDSSSINGFNILSDDKLYLNGSILQNCTIDGRATLYGTIALRYGVVLKGGLTNKGVLRNQNAYGVSVHLDDAFTNDGSIINHPTSGSLSIYLDGDFFNNGIYTPSSTYFTNSQTHEISQTTGKVFKGKYYCAPTDSLTLTSDLTFDRTEFYGNGGTAAIRTNGYTWRVDTGWVQRVYLIGNDSLFLNETVIREVTTNGNYHIGGAVQVGSSSAFKGITTVHGSLTNEAAYGITTTFEGTLINRGDIHINNSGSLVIDLYADLVNQGSYHPNNTIIKGNTTRQFEQSDTARFRGNLATQDTLDGIMLKSNFNFFEVNFNGQSNTPYSSISTNGHTIKFDTCNINRITFVGSDTLDFRSSVLSYGRTYGTPIIKGELNLHYDGQFHHGFVNHGIIQNLPGYGITTDFAGPVTNYGTIATNVSGSLTINLSGNLHNEGQYKPNSTYISGNTLRKFSQSNDVFFEGNFYTTDTLGGIMMESPVKFKKANLYWLNTSPYSRIITNGHALHADTSYLSNLRIVSNDTLQLQGSRFENVHTYMSPKLFGTCYLHYSTNFNDGFDNYGELVNTPGYGLSSQMGGQVNNFGTIGNAVSGSLTIKLHGNLHNEGVYSPSTTELLSDTLNKFSQSSDVYYRGNFTTVDTTGGIILGSDVRFSHTSLAWFNKAPYPSIVTNGYNFHGDTCYFGNVRFVSNDTLNLQGSRLENVHTYLVPNFKGTNYLHYNTRIHDGCANFGELVNTPGYGITTVFDGRLNNYGRIGNSSSGTLNVEVSHAIHNEGTYNPYGTYFVGEDLVELSQSGPVSFEGRFYANDTANGATLMSPITFSGATIDWINTPPYAALDAHDNKLTLENCYLSEVRLIRADTLIFDKTTLNESSVYGHATIDGTLTCHYDVTFMDSVRNLGILNNTAGYSHTTYFKSHFQNDGQVESNQSGGTLTMNLDGGLTNNGLYKPHYTYFYSNQSRTIAGANANGLQGNYYVMDTMSFVGHNTLPNLSMGTDGYLIIDTMASLECNEIHVGSRAKLFNYGSVLSTKSPNANQQIGYSRAIAKFYSSTNISQLSIEHFGHQQHPGAENAVNAWWRLKPNPLNVSDSLDDLFLLYENSELNGNPESDLKVYFSPNAGIEWVRIDTNVFSDTSKNQILIANAPSYGHYLLSSQDLGIVKFKPILHRAEPTVFGNKGSVTIYGFGLGMTNSMTVTLKKAGSPDIVADSVYLTDAIGESFIAKFDVNQVDIGAYSLYITIPGEAPLVLGDYFTVEKAERPEPWVMLNGRDRFLINRWQTFRIHYGNLSNTDARGVPLFFAVNDLPNMEVEFPDLDIGIPASFINDGWTQWQDTSIELYYTTDTFSGFEGTMMRIYPFYIPSIGALTSQSIRVKIKAPSDLNMTAWVTDPMIEGFEKQGKVSTPPEVAACLAKAAAKYGWNKAIDLVPGYDCYKLAYKVTETGFGYVMKDKNQPEKPATWGSWIMSGWGWAWSIVDCAGDIIPVSKGLKAAKTLVDIGFDIKSNYDADRECWEKFKAKKKGKHKSRGVSSFDPNEITGPSGYGPDGYIGRDAHPVYTVFFENKDTASAPATDVIVLDTLDKNYYDLNTFSFDFITIADSTYKIQAFAKDFRVLVDLAPRIQAIVQVTGSLDTSNGAIQVNYFTLDRSTLEPNEDWELGFLPPNKTKPEGEGNFSYSVGLKSGIAHDAELTNKALIFFDANKPIATNVHSNKIDTMAPQSYVTSLPTITTDSSFIVEWGGSDQGCGIQSYTIFVSENDSPYIAWLSNTSLTRDTFNGRDKHNYRFYSVAMDSLGLTEKHPEQADTETDVIDKSGVIELTLEGIRIFPNPVNNYLQVVLTNNNGGNLVWYDLHGKQLSNHILQPGVNQVDVNHLKDQTYIVRITTDEHVVHKKIVVRH